MTRISLAEEYDNRDMVAQMIALKNRQTESENTLVTYVSQCAASAQDAEDAKDAAVAAKDTAVAAATDTVRKTPAAAQTITGYPLTVTQGVTANLIGNVTGNVTGNADTATTASKLGSSTVGSAVKPIYLNGGTATVCNDMCDLASAQTVTGAKTFSGTTKVPTPGLNAASTEAVNVGYVSDTSGNLNNLVHTGSTETIAGIKIFTANAMFKAAPFIDSTTMDATTATADLFSPIYFRDKNGTELAEFRIYKPTTKITVLQVGVRNSDGTIKYITLGSGDVI